MADLLLELFSEEIPARMQAQAAKDLERLVVGALSDRGLLFEGAKTFAGPRRLTLALIGLAAEAARRQRRKERPAHQRAGEGDRRLSALGRCDARSNARSATTARASSTSP